MEDRKEEPGFGWRELVLVAEIKERFLSPKANRFAGANREENALPLRVRNGWRRGRTRTTAEKRRLAAAVRKMAVRRRAEGGLSRGAMDKP